MQQVLDSNIQGAADVLAIAADLTKNDDINHLVAEAVKKFGTIHVLVNNAGILGNVSLFEDLTDDEWFQVFNLNIFSLN